LPWFRAAGWLNIRANNIRTLWFWSGKATLCKHIDLLALRVNDSDVTIIAAIRLAPGNFVGTAFNPRANLCADLQWTFQRLEVIGAARREAARARRPGRDICCWGYGTLWCGTGTALPQWDFCV